MADKNLKPFYNSVKWKKLRQYVYTSRHGVCEICEHPAYEVHHIVPLTIDNVDNAEVSLSEDNLILLCHSCHSYVHSRFQSKYRTINWNNDGDIISVIVPAEQYNQQQQAKLHYLQQQLLQ